MDEGLTIKGDLRESGLPELLKSFLKNRESGILTLRRGDVAKSLYFKEGRIVLHEALL